MKRNLLNTTNSKRKEKKRKAKTHAFRTLGRVSE
jgi:hypothetical protein